MAQAVINADGVGFQPFLDHGRVDIVIIRPALIAGVIRRVDKDAVHLARIARQQRLERVQIVALDDQIAVQIDRPYAFVGMRLKRAERHAQMVVVDKFLALEGQFRHAPVLPNRATIKTSMRTYSQGHGFPIF